MAQPGQLNDDQFQAATRALSRYADDDIEQEYMLSDLAVTWPGTMPTPQLFQAELTRIRAALPRHTYEYMLQV